MMAHYDLANGEQMQLELDVLLSVLSEALGTKILSAHYQTKPLQGGTLGDVRLVAGTAQATDGRSMPYKIVLKTQKQWERPGDPKSWRREYDLYTSKLHTVFSDVLRWPLCYRAEDHGDEIRLWIEYIDGVSGLGLTPEMLERAALELGRLQGKLYRDPTAFLRQIENLNTPSYLKSEHEGWMRNAQTCSYLRNDECPIPRHLRKMMIDIEDDAESVFARIERLPIVFCHQDFWIENVFHTEEGIRLIDWDTTGWGYLGEDIAALIADDVDHAVIDEYYRRLIPAYYRGISEYMDTADISEHCIWEIILLRFGYRFVYGCQHAQTAEERDLNILALQKLYEVREVSFAK